MPKKIVPDKGIKSAMAGFGKKAYQKPALKTYGLVKHLTQSTGSANGDTGQNMML